MSTLFTGIHNLQALLASSAYSLSSAPPTVLLFDHVRDEYQVFSLLSDGQKGLRGSQVVTISEVGRADDRSKPVCFCSFPFPGFMSVCFVFL
jgi:hypothetical protein